MKQGIFSTLCVYTIAIVASMMFGCTGHSDTPVTPDSTPVSGVTSHDANSSQTHLWGLYDVTIDPDDLSVYAVPNRDAMFTANVVNFLNSNPANMKFSINGVHPWPNYLDIDINISITHPFPGLPQYNGYDVRGVFMGDGSATLDYNHFLIYPVKGNDQDMLADPSDGIGGPDGYTRWFNYAEFSTGGMPLFQYTPGTFASAGFGGNSTLNPYKYFANGLGDEEDLWAWLDDHAGQQGEFTSGATNGRNYYLRFPNWKGVTYGYAIIANWGGPEPDKHPSNTPEPVACNVSDTSTVYYVDPSTNGGDIILDISLWDWDSALTSTVMEDYTLYIESTVLQNVHQFDTSEMTPTGGDENFSTYHVEIPADNVTGVNGNEYWIIAEETGEDYTNDFGVPNLADTDPLAAFFRFDLNVSGDPGNTPPVINGITDDIDPDGLNVEVDDTDTAVNYIVDFTDPDVGQTHTIDWYIEDSAATDPTDPADAVPYDWSIKDLGDYKIWVKVNDGYVTVTGGPYDISKVERGWVRTWGAGNQDRGYGIAVDSVGDIYVVGDFYNTVDFDPGPGVDNHNSGGNRDSYVTKFTPAGEFLWAATWGGNVSFGGGATDVAVDLNDNVLVSGYYYGTDVDFDPGPDEDLHTSVGDADAYISVFDTDGNHLWARSWGGTHEYGDSALGVDADMGGNIYVVGQFRDTVDFDPGPGEDIETSNGYRDFFLTSFDSSGNHRWAHHFGGWVDDFAFGCEVDNYGNVCIAGRFNDQMDFDPGPGEDIHDENVEGNMYLAKFEPDGDFLWAKAFGQGDAFRIDYDSSNNIYLSGVWGGISQFDPDNFTEERVAAGSRDCYLSKFDENGVFQWVLTWDSIAPGDMTSGYIGHHVHVDQDDYIYCTAHFTGTADLDPDTVDVEEHTSNGERDLFVTKFDPTGDLVWTRALGGISTDDGGGVAADSAGHVYSTGWFFDTVDFDPGPDVEEHTAVGSLDAFLLKLMPDGLW